MIKKTPIIILIAAGAMALAFIIPGALPGPAGASALAAPEAAGVVVIPPGNPIELALANSLVIPEAADIPLAVAMAIDDYGPIQGFDVTSILYDTGCNAGTAATVAASIVAFGQHPGVIGPLCSSSVTGALPVFETAGLVMVSGSATAVDLHTFGPNMFNRTVVDDTRFEAWNNIIGGLQSVADWETGFETAHGHYPWELARYAYDATTLLLTRIDEVAVIGGGGSLQIDREVLATAVRTTMNFPGVTANVALDADGMRVDQFVGAYRADEFDQTSLDSNWSWVDEDPSHWSLTANPGYLRIVTQSPTQNLLVTTAPSGVFEIRTHILFEPVENFQFAGLSVHLDGDNFLHLGRAYCGPCIGNGVYFDFVEGGVFDPENYETATTVPDEIYLRIIRSGNDYTGYFSENGTEWQMVGTHTAGFEPAYVGLYTSGQSAVSEVAADYDFFVLHYAAIPIYLPIVIRE